MLAIKASENGRAIADYDAAIHQRMARLRVLKELMDQECALLARDLTERMYARNHNARSFRPVIVRPYPD